MLKPKARRLKAAAKAAAPPPPPAVRDEVRGDYEKALQIDRQHLEGQVRHFEREVRSMRIQIAEKEEALQHYVTREASFVQTNESLRARLAAYQGVKELTEATESQNGSLRGQLKHAYEASAKVESDLATTTRLLGQSCDEATAAKEACEELSARLARVEGEKREAVAAGERYVEEIGACKVLQGETEQRLRGVIRENDELRIQALDLERAASEARAAEEHAKQQLQAALRSCDVAEADAKVARERAWEHHLKVAETKALGVDLQRLVRLLTSTGEYRHFGALWRDSDVDDGVDVFPGGASYVGPAASDPFVDEDLDYVEELRHGAWQDRPNAGPPSAEEMEREWSAFAALAETHGANGDPVVPHKEDGNWAPRKAVLAAREFHQTHIPNVPFEVIREFLHKTNAIWLTREKNHCNRLHAAFQKRIDDMFRKTQHGMPYEKVIHEREVKALKEELKKARSRNLKGRPKKPVSRKFPSTAGKWYSDMRSTARDELLAASLNAVEKIAMDRITDSTSRSPSPSRSSNYSARGPYSSRAFT